MQSKSSKKIYLAVMLVLVLFLGLAAEAMASHFRYGHITWTRDSGTSKTVTFRIQTAWRVLFGGGDTRLCFSDANGAKISPVSLPESTRNADMSHSVLQDR